MKNLLAHTKAFKTTTADAFNKVAQGVESLVKLTEEDGGDLALGATRLRSIVARIQVRWQTTTSNTAAASPTSPTSPTRATISVAASALGAAPTIMT